MQIKLKQLTLENFKGIRSLTVEFDDNTTISGNNGTGKTTIFDSFTWLLFGKNARDEKDFGIKTLENGQVIPKIEHSVEGIIEVDGVTVTLKRTFTEKWTRRRGSEETEFTGHETAFYYNGAPVQAGDYAKRINDMVPENLFKLLTSSTYFNSMKWQDRRQVLITMAGAIADSDIMATMPKAQIKVLTDILNSGKPITDLKRELSARKKKLQDELAAISPRVDEVKRGTPEPLDYEAIKSQLYNQQMSLLVVEAAITAQVDAYKEETDKQTAIHKQIGTLRQQIQTIEFEQRSASQKDANARTFKINDLKQKLQGMSRTFNSTKDELERLIKSKADTEASLVSLRAKFAEEAAKVLTFNEGQFTCPTCKRELDPDTITTKQGIMQADFEKAKGITLTTIKAEGERLKKGLEQIVTEIGLAEQRVNAIDTDAKALAAELAEAEQQVSAQTPQVEEPRIAPIRSQIETLELSLLAAPKLDIDGLKQQKGEIQMDIDVAKRLLQTEEQIKASAARIKELLKQEKELAQQLADIEKQDFAMQAYTTASMDIVERRVNDKFSIVKWKMFNTLINGGVEETCEATVNGVPYSDVNSAGKIQAGIDCINALGAHYGYNLPVWVDNRESVNELPETTVQVINLVVSTDKSLTIK